MPPRKRSTDPERVGPLLNPKERREAVEVFGRAFTNPTWMEGHVRRSLYKAPIFKPEHTRVVIAGGRVAAAMVMGPRMMRFGPVKVPAMTIGPVGTHDAFRKRGFAAAAMDDASAYMAENGYLIAYLWGIPDFYYRFGYYPYMVPCHVTLKRDAARKEALPGRLRAMRRKDLPAVRRLYEAVTAGRICAAARDKAVWDWLLGPGSHTWTFRKPRVILDAHGRTCGYITVNIGSQWHQGEVVVRQDEASCRAALGAIAREARRREVKEVTFPLPWDDALAVLLRQFVGAEFKMVPGPTGGPLMKVVDFPALMRRLQPLFSRRWQAANTALRGARFTMETEDGAVGIAAGPDGVSVDAPGAGRRVVIPRRWLSGLLTGYYGVRQVAPRKGASVPRELLPVMDLLFPAGWPFAYQGDNY
jgi:predicted acetyltransferase